MATGGLTLTPDERVAYPYLFAKADTDRLGVLVGEKAVAFFDHSRLPPTVLGEIWQLADEENAGFLTREQFDKALRLIGKAQRGTPPTKEALSTPGPLARLEGFSVPGVATPQSPLPTGNIAPQAQIPATLTGSSIGSINVISAEDKAKYARLFSNAGPVDGLLDGDKARDMFIKSRLPFEKLGQIWTLADTQSRGSLSLADFAVAMHLIQLSMSGRLPTLPTSLPPGLLESAASGVGRQATGLQQALPSSPLRQQATPSQAALPRQVTGTPATPSSRFLNSSTLGASAFGRAASPSTLDAPWDITQAELVQSNTFFDQLDQGRDGFVPGDRAVPFLMESKLPGDVLAHVWDLADIRGEGRLNREEFAVAMRLIQDKLAGKELPGSLSMGMVPPSLRAGVAAGTNVPSQQASETQRDLLSLMDDNDDVPAPMTATSAAGSRAFGGMQPLAPQSTGNSITSQSRQKAASPAPRAGIASPPRVKSPLANGAPSIGSLPAQRTGQSNQGGFTDSFTSEPFDDSGVKLGNLQNQLSSTERAVGTLQSERSQLQGQESSTAAQISELETKIATARASHANETRLVETLRGRQAEQTTTLAKLKEDAIRAESDLSALRMEKTELEGNLLRDKEEVRNMQKQMVSLNEQTAQLKAALEKVKKDARQQKGLVAIGKKQLATSEGHRDTAETALSQAEQEAAASVSEPTSNRETEPAAVEPTKATSPALSTTSVRSTNPFDRMLSTASTGSALPASLPQGQHHVAELGAGAAVGAVGGALAGHVLSESDDHKQVAPTSMPADQEAEEDPFGVESAPSGDHGAARHSNDTFGFDDAFGTTHHEQSDPSHFEGFDEAFATQPETMDVPLEPQVTSTADHDTATKPVAHILQTEGSAEPKLSPAGDADESSESSDDEAVEDAIGYQPHRSPDPAHHGTVSDAADKFPPVEDVDQRAPLSGAPVADVTDGIQIEAAEEHSIPGGFPESSVVTPAPSSSDVLDKVVPSPHRRPPPPLPPSRVSSHPLTTPVGTAAKGFEATGTTSTASEPAASTQPSLPALKSNAHAPPAGPAASATSADDFTDFESSFASLPQTSHGASDPTKHDFGGFDESFDKSFDASHHTAAQSAHGPGTTDFDTSFADFDDAFGGGAAPHPRGAQDPSAFSFDDAFGADSGTGQAPTASGAQDPRTPPAAKATPDGAREDDSDAVKEIVSMGFSRTDAIKALERDDFNISRALNHLLG